MTGFGTCEKDGFKVEIRSLNHRFLEISVRLLPWLNEHEAVLRSIIKENFSRGKVDASVSFKDYSKIKFKANTDLAKELCSSMESLKKELSLSGSVGLETLLNYKEFLLVEEPDFNTESLYSAFKEAVEQVQTMRKAEGETLRKDMADRIGVLESLNKEIVNVSPEVSNSYKLKVLERIKELTGCSESEQEKFCREIAVLAEKSDITEENVRIENHLKHFRKILGNGDTIGKQLDFLLQELNREMNTISSKASNYRISKIAIDMKSGIEKIREQAQNIQ